MSSMISIQFNGAGCQKIASGKVRELIKVDDNILLFIATDRVSAYDVVMNNGIPEKGEMLTQLSAHWFEVIAEKLPHIKTHFLTTHVPVKNVLEEAFLYLAKRCMTVKPLNMIPLESIVRGYITGSAWAEYKKSGTIHGMPAPAGLQESQKLDAPLWTPSTKAAGGEHDENIDEARAIQLIGAERVEEIKRVSIEVYEMAHEYALQRGIIIADTKFEFGIDPKTNELVLADEVLTPDSSRFWSASKYSVGKPQESFDKQFIRDWLVENDLKGVKDVCIPDVVVLETVNKYRDAYQMLTGKYWVPKDASKFASSDSEGEPVDVGDSDSEETDSDETNIEDLLPEGLDVEEPETDASDAEE